MPALSGSQKALMQSRFGIARFGATRFGYYVPNQVVVIGGVDCSTKVEKGSVGITLNPNDVPDSCRFTLIPNPGFTPQQDQPVVIGLGTAANAEFTGSILTVTHRRRPANQSPFFDIICTDQTRLLNRRVVTGDWTAMSIDQIAIDVITRFTAGFTYFNVQLGLPVLSTFSATNELVSSVLRRLASAANGGCYWARSDVHLFGPAGETGSRAPSPPQPITNTNATLIGPPTPGGIPFSHQYDTSQTRTRDIVEGHSTSCPVSTPDGAVSVVVNGSNSVDYLVVAGGGAGGAGAAGGGGGGGGAVLTGTDVLPAGAYGIVVGAGAAAVGGDGLASSFNGHSAAGGGGGGGSVSGHSAGDSGGNGGGGNGANAGGSGTQGFAGGNGDQTLSAAGGGGGGAGGAGGAAGPNTSGVGGPGVSSSLSGAPMYYGGGGGGNAVSGPIGSGGIGGGGHGGAGGNPSTPGTANTGGGGGGSQDNIAANQQGGSGIVILRYPTGSVSATGGSITTSGGYTIHTFTSNGTFTVSTVTLTAPAPLITDIPLADASQIDAGGGNVRIGNQLFSYLSTAGPIVASGANPPGSSLSADANATDTTLNVTGASSIFTAAPGWVQIGSQFVRYTGVGASTLTGIPAVGFGSLTAAVKAGTSVTWLGSLVISNTGVTIAPPISAGDPVVQRVIVDDVTAQANLAALQGGGSDGIIEHVITDSTLDIAGATQAASADLASFSGATLLANWTTFDQNARPPAKQVINRATPDPVSGTVTITQVDISFPAPHHLPVRKCQGSTVRLSGVVDVIAVDQR